MNPVIAELLISAAIACVYWRTRSWLQEWDCAWRHGEHHTPAEFIVRDGEWSVSAVLGALSGDIYCRECGRIISRFPTFSCSIRPQWERALKNIAPGEWAMFLRRVGSRKVKKDG